MITESLAEYEPRLPSIMIAFILIAVMIGLYVYFGFNFFNKGRKSRIDAQKSYYQGLGFFIITVAISESLYLLDYLYRVLRAERLFSTIEAYEDEYGITIDSMFEGNYFIFIFMFLSFGLIFLASPLEKYLMGRKHRPLTIASMVSVPMPAIARVLELNWYEMTGNELIENTTGYFITTGIWLLNLAVLVVCILLLFSQYLKMGISAPPGSKLRSKSKQIVLGLTTWIFAILFTSSIMKELWEGGDEWLARVAIGSLFSWIYHILPFVIPALLLASLLLVTSGFTREYD